MELTSILKMEQMACKEQVAVHRNYPSRSEFIKEEYLVLHFSYAYTVSLQMAVAVSPAGPSKDFTD